MTKKTFFSVAFSLLFTSLSAVPNWDIYDKSMADYSGDGGASNNKPWTSIKGSSAASVLTQNAGYVNFFKTNVGNSGRWAWTKPSATLSNLTEGQAYSIEIKARVQPIDKVAFPDNSSNYEANQIALRLGYKGTAMPIFLRYGDSSTGSVSTVSGAQNAVALNTSEWQVYRIVIQPNHLKYDVYVDGIDEPIFTNVAKINTSDAAGIYFGAESQHRCNLDIEYVKMGTGDFFSKPKITSVTLSQQNQLAQTEATVAITVTTAAFTDGTSLSFSLVETQEGVIIEQQTAAVINNQAVANLTIPASAPVGYYCINVFTEAQVGGMDVAPQRLSYEIIDPVAAQTWNILNRNFGAHPWNQDPLWTIEKGANVPSSFVAQKIGFLTIDKSVANGSDHYAFLTSPQLSVSTNTAYTLEFKARLNPIDKNTFPDVIKPPVGTAGGYESNQIALQLNNKYMSAHLIYGDEQTGYVASHVVDGTGPSPSLTQRHKMNTSEWHTYRLIINPENTHYDLYVDGVLVFEQVLILNKNGKNYVKMGGESWQRCNMDIEYVRVASGDLFLGTNPKIKSIELSSDSHIAGSERTIQLTANTVNVANGQALAASLIGTNGEVVIPEVDFTVTGDKTTYSFTIPATVPLGKYEIKVATPDNQIAGQDVASKAMQYVVVDVSPIETKVFPQLSPIGYVKDIDDYIYTTKTKEFIFPSIIDTKKFTVDGKFKNGQTPINRYYLYYSPHENPGGMFLSTSASLDGPWTEFDGSAGMTPGTVMDFAWAEKQSEIIKNGAERHISGCHVVWNDVQQKFIMYFHGPNTTTHYATSDNLTDWTFGESIIVSHQFSAIGAEASYAKVFEHEIDGLGNKYIMLLMNQENQIRRIYWAHSKDGIQWTTVPKPIASPDLEYKKVPGTDHKPNYHGGGTGALGNNMSGPFLMERNGRYYVIVQGCSDNLMVIEVGKNFDMEVHWGEYIKKKDVIFTVNGVPKEIRIAAPSFIQDDNGKWYMFFEAGGRLDANIGYAKETTATKTTPVSGSKHIKISPTSLKKNEELMISSDEASELVVKITNLAGTYISSKTINGHSGSIKAPADSGIYIVQVTTNHNQELSSKIIVK